MVIYIDNSIERFIFSNVIQKLKETYNADL